MNLLFVTSIVPDGGRGSGYEIANAAIVDGLRRIGANVTVLGYSWPGKQAEDPDNTIVLGEIDVRTASASALQKAAWLMRAVASGMTFASAKLTDVSPAAVRALVDRRGPFDVYVLNGAQMAGAYRDVFRDQPCIFVAHNVEHRSAAENAEAAHGGFQRLLYRREAALLATLEPELCANARYVFTLADEDRNALGVDADSRSVTLPLVTTARPPRPAGKRGIECDAALIGTWSWQPNRTGLEWFLDEVTPHLPPGFRTEIAGHVPDDIKPKHPGVKLVGRVPDAAAFVRRAAVISLISRAGTGVQLKTIETFELGLPSVATSLSLRGIDAAPANCVRCDDPRAFAAHLVRVASARPADLDGRTFHASQRAGLDRRLGQGLVRAGLSFNTSLHEKLA